MGNVKINAGKWGPRFSLRKRGGGGGGGGGYEEDFLDPIRDKIDALDRLSGYQEISEIHGMR